MTWPKKSLRELMQNMTTDDQHVLTTKGTIVAITLSIRLNNALIEAVNDKKISKKQYVLDALKRGLFLDGYIKQVEEEVNQTRDGN